MRDIVGLHLAPPQRALALRVDEKTGVQALDHRTQPLLPMRPGRAERRTHDCARHGTTSLFAALDIKTGTVIGRCLPRHRAAEFRRFLDAVEVAVPAGLLLTEKALRRGVHLGPAYFREIAVFVAGGVPDPAKMRETMLRHGLVPIPPL